MLEPSLEEGLPSYEEPYRCFVLFTEEIARKDGSLLPSRPFKYIKKAEKLFHWIGAQVLPSESQIFGFFPLLRKLNFPPFKPKTQTTNRAVVVISNNISRRKLSAEIAKVEIELEI